MFGVFDGHGGREVACFAEKHFPTILSESDLFQKEDYKEALRKGFLKVDEALNNGGLKEVAEMKIKFPPVKSAMLKLFSDTMA